MLVFQISRYFLFQCADNYCTMPFCSDLDSNPASSFQLCPQEKAELHQRAQGLQLQLERAERGREGYTDQVCELHTELSNARTSTTQHQRQCLVMEEELSAAKQVSEPITTAQQHTPNAAHSQLPLGYIVTM